jgi:hypothetical protein
MTVINWAKWAQYRACIEACLVDGFTPYNQADLKGKGSALQEAQRRLIDNGIITTGLKTTGQLYHWIQAQIKRHARGLRHEMPDWGLYKQHGNAARVYTNSTVTRRWLLTAAQNDTAIHAGFWHNLQALAAYYAAQIHVGKFTYQTSVALERNRKRDAGERELKWDAALAAFLIDKATPCGKVTFCAEMNTLPTAVRPLSSLHTYGRGKTVIFPHAKVALEAVPVMPDHEPPLVLTTGCCTIESYTDTKAGHKAIFHHVIGAVLVEEDAEGRVFIRHIIASQDGSFQDLTLKVRNGKVTTGHRVKAITYGDVHSPFIDSDKAKASWGFDVANWSNTQKPCMLDVLRPEFQFFHDVCDFKSISHHEEKQSGERFKTFMRGHHKVRQEIKLAAQFLRATTRDFCRSVVIGSNHDRWLDKWLDQADHRKDRDNTLAYLEYSLARAQAIECQDDNFDTFRYALREADSAQLEGVEFSGYGQSFEICQEYGAIECGNHGDLGSNGARGTPTGLTKVATRMSIGDKHSPAIWDGLYIAGVSSPLRRDYNKAGPSSWMHADIITYANGKRTLIFTQDGKFCA